MATDLGAEHETATPARATRRSRAVLARRIAGALPAAILLLVFGFFLVDKRSEALTAFRSTRALLIIGGIVVGWVALSWLLRRFVRQIWIQSAVLTAGALALAIVFVLPYYRDTTDNTTLVKGKLRDASELSTPGTAGAANTPAPSTAPPAPAGPVRVATGTLRGIGHRAAGGVSLIRQPDGALVVRFERFDIQSTPDPIVYVVPGADAQDPGGADLGSMRGNQGTASDYAVPAGTDAKSGWTVLVWCRSFSTPIANATLDSA